MCIISKQERKISINLESKEGNYIGSDIIELLYSLPFCIFLP